MNTEFWRQALPSKREAIWTLTAGATLPLVAFGIAMLIVALWASPAGADSGTKAEATEACNNQPDHRGDMVVVQSQDGDTWRCMPDIWYPVWHDGNTYCAPAAKRSNPVYCSPAAAHPETFIQDGQIVAKSSGSPGCSNNFPGNIECGRKRDANPPPTNPNTDTWEEHQHRHGGIGQYMNKASYCNWHPDAAGC